MKQRTRVVARAYMVMHALAGIALIYPVAIGDLDSIGILFVLTSWVLVAVWRGVPRLKASSWWFLVCLYALSTSAIATVLLQVWFTVPRPLFEGLGTVLPLTGLFVLATPLDCSMALYLIALLALYGFPTLILMTDRPSGWGSSRSFGR